MQHAMAPLLVHRGLRGDVLIALKKAQPLTAKELAERFGVTPNALRRHLKALEDDGLVCFRREVRGVGGPVYAYSLTRDGESLFPRTYMPALSGALEALREEHGSEALVRLFRRQWDALADDARDRLAELPLGERTQLLAELLSSQGYMAEAECRSATEATIREHNCALREVAERFPELCAAEADFLADTLGAAVERRRHIVRGCNACEYVIRAGRDGG